METATVAGEAQPEPWLRGTFREIPAVPRALLHALQLTREDAARWCAGLTREELNERPFGLPSVAFHIRHIAGSLDRLLTYAEGRPLGEDQSAALAAEQQPSGTGAEALLAGLASSLDAAWLRIRTLANGDLEQARFVGRRRLPTTLGGLLIHLAEHTQRHSGQVVVTARLLLARREATS
jgi:uncharacterized damage-inducible protein DinB